MRRARPRLRTVSTPYRPGRTSVSCAADYIEKAMQAAKDAQDVDGLRPEVKRQVVMERLAWAQFNMLRAIEQRLLVIEDSVSTEYVS